jgi:hypothetical protein
LDFGCDVLHPCKLRFDLSNEYLASVQRVKVSICRSVALLIRVIKPRGNEIGGVRRTNGTHENTYILVGKPG